MNTALSPSRALWDYLCSLKLAMILLLTLAVASIIGTVIPQGNLSPEYIQSIGQAKLKLYSSLGFFDMYHSWWFVLLLVALSVNLFACSVNRVPRIWKDVVAPVVTMDDALRKSLPNLVTLKVAGSAEALRDRIAAALGDSFARPRITEQDGVYHLFAQKTPWCRLAVYVVHLSILVIFVGAIAGSLFGMKGYVAIPEGSSIAAVESRNGGKPVDLGFAVRCDRFSVSFYDTGAPKEFKSLLTVLENGKPVPGYDHVPVIVNDPLTYKGITFYQSSYGKSGEHRIQVSALDGSNPVTLEVPSDGEVRLPDGGAMHVLESTPDVAQFEPGKSGPAANLEVHTGTGNSYRTVSYARHPEANLLAAQRNGGLLFNYLGGREVPYTGLQVAKDPGVPIVWAGCFLMVIGVYCAFFLSRRRIWVTVRGGEVVVGGRADKNPAGFELAFNRIVEKIKGEISPREER